MPKYLPPDEYDKPSLIDRTILKILKARKKKKLKTTRTKGIEKQAQENYGTDIQKELAKLRRKSGGK